MPDPLSLSPSAVDVPEPQVWQAIVATDAVVVTDEVYVTIPSFDSGDGQVWKHGPCKWSARIEGASLFYPKRGDPCVVNISEEGIVVITQWTNLASTPDTVLGVGDITGAEATANKDTDGTLAGNSDIRYPSQRAVKTALATKQDSLGFTPENTANKDTTGTLGTSDVKFPSQKAVKTYVDSLRSYVDTGNGLLIPKALVDAKGDLLVATAADTVARKAIGTNGQLLSADSSKADGLAWINPARTVSGIINTSGSGSIVSGTGFTIRRNSTGNVTVTFSTAFTTIPATVFAVQTSGVVAAVHVAAPTRSTFQFVAFNTSFVAADSIVHFMTNG